MTTNHLTQQLKAGLSALHLDVAEGTQAKLIAFLKFLQRWNKAYNLTAIRELDQMVTYHLLDSLSISPHLQGQNILDVGTGAGFPGLPLALAHPSKQFVLLDSNGKKVRFLIQAKAEFGIDNIEIVQARVQNFSSRFCFDAIICRALATMAEVISNTQHLLCPNGQWLLMKGNYPEAEIEKVDKKVSVFPLSVPGLSASRHLVVVTGDSSD